MRRIGLAVVLVVTLGLAPFAAEAQQAGRIWRIGLLDYGSPDSARLAWWMAFQVRFASWGTWKDRMSSFNRDGETDR
jgi:hypothetical protein